MTGEAAKLRDVYAEKPVVELDAPPVCQGIFFRLDFVRMNINNIVILMNYYLQLL